MSRKNTQQPYLPFDPKNKSTKYLPTRRETEINEATVVIFPPPQTSPKIIRLGFTKTKDENETTRLVKESNFDDITTKKTDNLVEEYTTTPENIDENTEPTEQLMKDFEQPLIEASSNEGQTFNENIIAVISHSKEKLDETNENEKELVVLKETNEDEQEGTFEANEGKREGLIEEIEVEKEIETEIPDTVLVIDEPTIKSEEENKEGKEPPMENDQNEEPLYPLDEKIAIEHTEELDTIATTFRDTKPPKKDFTIRLNRKKKDISSIFVNRTYSRNWLEKENGGIQASKITTKKDQHNKGVDLEPNNLNIPRFCLKRVDLDWKNKINLETKRKQKPIIKVPILLAKVNVDHIINQKLQLSLPTEKIEKTSITVKSYNGHVIPPAKTLFLKGIYTIDVEFTSTSGSYHTKKFSIPWETTANIHWLQKPDTEKSKETEFMFQLADGTLSNHYQSEKEYTETINCELSKTKSSWYHDFNPSFVDSRLSINGSVLLSFNLVQFQYIDLNFDLH
ncbi:hypothetical protein H1D32_11300 [Anaerobacillus sp. CMMVII]|uniref:hypothetical protein n=1 Tax=Anaerobacillus sp. CMMVII TaxID=2755588 RepID=UPI0021B74FF9|nr:hypothetical protein [Anaerobacillus sp. CMMVII]MCT8138284.1 hypothetical protein [Anaerobacillus sp. CMMVII]